ncbi:hypothetical protein LA080_007445 [Diaporthe eres]|nr:hypothetical protein LA080_007445 [Diaporthe eres]
MPKHETNRVKRHHRVLKNLIFDSIYTRENKIEVAHINALEWLFDSPITNFRVWLETGSGVYWISGLKWAGRQEMVISSHYLWIAGTEMQKSLEGLLRTLLLHVFRKTPKLIDALLPEQVGLQPTHSLSELKSLVSKLQGEELGCCFCFFIDGLDEYHGAEEKIIHVYFVVRGLLQDIRDNKPLKQLQKRIDSYPIQLGAFFDVIMDRIDQVHMKSAARLMLSSTMVTQPLSVLALVILEEEEDFVLRSEIYTLSKDDLVDLFNNWQPRLQNRCRDLVKLKTTRGQPGSSPVELLHRTVRDFLLNEHRDELQIKAGAGFDAKGCLCQVKRLELKRAEQDHDGSSHRLQVMKLLHYANLMEQEPLKSRILEC